MAFHDSRGISRVGTEKLHGVLVVDDDSTVTALHVVAPMPAVVPAAYYIGTETPPVALPQTDHAMVAAQVQRLIDEEDVAGVRVDTRVEEAPTVHGEILVQAERLGSDLIVMGHTTPC